MGAALQADELSNSDEPGVNRAQPGRLDGTAKGPVAWLDIHLRIVIICVVFLTTVVAAFILRATQLRFRGVRLSNLVVQIPVRILHRLWRLDVRCSDEDLAKLRQHQGLILCNHQSFVDITALASLMPVRFVAAVEVSGYQILGNLARATDTVFVDRGNRRSATSMREDLTRIMERDPAPPYVIYPEGVVGVADDLFPFHRGAFRFAVEEQIPYLPCVVQYSHPLITCWADPDNTLIGGLYRMFRARTATWVKVTVLDPVHPTSAHRPQDLRRKTREDIAEVLGVDLAVADANRGTVKEAQYRDGVLQQRAYPRPH